VDADLSSGGHQTAWDGKDMRGAGVSSGTYLARIDFGTVHETKRLTLIK
jgi:flagellar hook assembly protein FlgD